MVAVTRPGPFEGTGSRDQGVRERRIERRGGGTTDAITGERTTPDGRRVIRHLGAMSRRRRSSGAIGLTLEVPQRSRCRAAATLASMRRRARANGAPRPASACSIASAYSTRAHNQVPAASARVVRCRWASAATAAASMCWRERLLKGDVRGDGERRLMADSGRTNRRRRRDRHPGPWEGSSALLCALWRRSGPARPLTLAQQPPKRILFTPASRRCEHVKTCFAAPNHMSGRIGFTTPGC